jgi:hypothetical protein
LYQSGLQISVKQFDVGNGGADAVSHPFAVLSGLAAIAVDV